MKITFIKLFNNKKKEDNVFMKFLRDDEFQKKGSCYERAKHSKSRAERISKKRKHEAKYTSNNINNFIKNILSKKVIKKNQVVLVATALMLVTAGYMNYTNNIKMADLGDAQLVSTNVMSNLVNELTDNNEKDSSEIIENKNVEKNIVKENAENVSGEEVVETSSKNSDEYYTKTRLERDTMFSQMLETYQKILENSSIPNDQKSIASNEIKNINNRKNQISTMENLIKNKEIQDVVILYNDSSINVVVKSDKDLSKEKIAQITNIVTSESGVDLEEIHVSVKN